MTQTLTTEQLKNLSYSGGIVGDLARELLANREAQPVAVTDEMALAFHRALNDGGIGESDLEEIKVGLRGALCNITAPPAPAVQSVVDWRLDESTGAKILMYKDCSVIEDQQAEYVLSLIQAAAPEGWQ